MSNIINKAEIVVIGGGPAGLCAAIAAGRKLKGSGKKVILLDTNPQPGAKLLISGSGQCNYTNALEPDEFIKKLGKYGNYLKSAYFNFDSRHFVWLLEEGGCPGFIREDNKIFPRDFKSQSVLNAFLNRAEDAGVDIRCSSRVSTIDAMPGGGFRLGFENGAELGCQKLIMATGGASYPATGSDGKALKLAKKLGHTGIPFRPHLCSVSIRDFEYLRPCAGISVVGVQARFVSGSGIHEAVGDLLITHGGFSGPLIMDNSHLLKANDEIIINWIPYADELLIDLRKQLPGREIHNALEIAGLPHRLLLAVLASNYIVSVLRMHSLNNKKLREYGHRLMACSYEISQVSGLSKAMASAGGIPLEEINSKTMQSRICHGLYFAGEIMDYALPTGGFNIQMAASTGWMAGEHAAEA